MTTKQQALDALDRLYRGAFGVHIRDGDEIQQDYELLSNALQSRSELVEALNSVDCILNWMANDRANYTANELRGMAKKALEFKQKAIAKAESNEANAEGGEK